MGPVAGGAPGQCPGSVPLTVGHNCPPPATALIGFASCFSQLCHSQCGRENSGEMLPTSRGQAAPGTQVSPDLGRIARQWRVWSKTQLSCLFDLGILRGALSQVGKQHFYVAGRLWPPLLTGGFLSHNPRQTALVLEALLVL